MLAWLQMAIRELGLEPAECYDAAMRGQCSAALRSRKGMERANDKIAQLHRPPAKLN